MHFFQKKSKAFQVFFVMRKETGAVLDGENLGSSLQKNNSRVLCCFSLSCADVSVEGGLRQCDVLFSASGLCL